MGRRSSRFDELVNNQGNETANGQGRFGAADAGDLEKHMDGSGPRYNASGNGDIAMRVK